MKDKNNNQNLSKKHHTSIFPNFKNIFMVTTFHCHLCGNTDTSKAKEYNGMLGYEAIICTVCGSYADHTAEHLPDAWSKQFIKPEKPPMMYKGFLISRKETPFQGLKYCAHRLHDDVFINPLFSYWWELRSVIDALK